MTYSLTACTAIAFVVIIIILLIYRHCVRSPRARRARKYKEVVSLDDPKKRQKILQEMTLDSLDSLDADELFTRATLYLRAQDDLQDRYFSNTASLSKKEQQYLARQLQNVSELARKTIRKAIEKRSQENKNNPEDTAEAQVFHDEAIERRAIEIEIQAPLGAQWAPPGRVVPPLEELRAIAPPAIPIAGPKWTPDPENVHDSAVGNDVSHRLQFLRENDLNLFDTRTCLGEISFILADRLNPKDAKNADKRKKVIRTMERAMQNDQCERYGISELEALRLVMERSHHARTEEGRNNLHDSLLNAMADCSEGDRGTVCTVGRISRYVASLDAVDENLPDGGVVKSVDAYRAEILEQLGRAQAAKGATDATVRDQMEKTLAEYAEKIPVHSMEKIRAECIAALA